MRRFIDAQLLIAAQTTSVHANALYSAAALDLSRQGVFILKAGWEEFAIRWWKNFEKKSKSSIQKEISKLIWDGKRFHGVETKRGKGLKQISLS